MLFKVIYIEFFIKWELIFNMKNERYLFDKYVYIYNFFLMKFRNI